MQKPIDYTNRKIGMLYFTGQAPHSASGKTCWYADCDCGKDDIVVYQTRIAKGQMDCGCVNLDNNGRKSKRTHKRPSPTAILKLHPILDAYLIGRIA